MPKKARQSPSSYSTSVESCTKWIHWWRSLQTGQPNECEQWVPGCTNKRHKVSRPCNPLAHRCKTHPQFIWVSTLENRSNFSCVNNMVFLTKRHVSPRNQKKLWKISSAPFEAETRLYPNELTWRSFYRSWVLRLFHQYFHPVADFFFSETFHYVHCNKLQGDMLVPWRGTSSKISLKAPWRDCISSAFRFFFLVTTYIASLRPCFALHSKNFW